MALHLLPGIARLAGTDNRENQIVVEYDTPIVAAREGSEVEVVDFVLPGPAFVAADHRAAAGRTGSIARVVNHQNSAVAESHWNAARLAKDGRELAEVADRNFDFR